jgi:hypothetical protein
MSTSRSTPVFDASIAYTVIRVNALYSRPTVDLVSECEERLNLVARYEAALTTGNYADAEEAARLSGGIAYELHCADELTAELERREREKQFGFRSDGISEEPDLAARFARLRAGGAQELADLIGLATNQPGRKSGSRWYFCCPFHGAGQERTASLVAFPDGYAHCFSCGWHGDGAAFVAEMKGIGMVEALLLLERGAA